MFSKILVVCLVRSVGESLLTFFQCARVWVSSNNIDYKQIQKKRFLGFVFFTFLLSTVAAQIPQAPVRLRTDFLLHPDLVSSRGIPVSENIQFALQEKEYYQVTAIQSPHPVLNWEMDTAVKAITAMRILVASSEEILQSNHGDYWDSRKIPVRDCRKVYNGNALKPGQLYYWKVQIWNDKDVASAFSGVSTFYYAPDTGKKAFTHYPLAAEIQKAVSIQQQNPAKYFIDFGKDGFAQLYLHLNSNRADSIWVEAAEALSGKGSILKSNGNIRYIRMGLYVEKGTHDYTLVWPVNEKRNKRNPALMPAYIGEVFPFRYVVIENYDGQMDPKTVQRKLIHYPFDETASAFHSNDSVINKVWDLCRYSMKATSFTGYYVDGDRERLPYEADALINQLSHYAVDAEYSIARRSMEFLLFHPTWPTEWSLQNIMLAWNDYMYTGNDAYLKEFYPELQKKILMPLAGPNGLISTRAKKQEDGFLESIHMMKDFDGKHGLKDNVDWPQKGDYIGPEKEYGGETDGFVYTDYNAVINAYYYHVLGLMQKIARVLNKPSDALLYKKTAEQVYQSFQQVFKNRKTGLYKDGDTTLHSSLHANMFALVFGLVPEKEIPNVIRFIKTRKMACSVYGAQFLLEALYDAGEDKYALDLLSSTGQRSWYNMIRVGSTITMEAWDKLYKPNLDLNHAWGAAPANIIVRKMMGIEPLTPGFGKFQVKMQPGYLQSASLKTTVIKGMIRLSWEKTAKETTVELTVPGATFARVLLPGENKKFRIMYDGKKIQPKLEKGFYVIENVTAGHHRFQLNQFPK